MKGNPVCLKCETSESPIWTNAENLGAICLDCINETKDSIKNELEDDDDNTYTRSRRRTRTTRSYKTRHNPLALPKICAPKGRGRRAFNRRTPVKAPSAVSSPVTADSVFYKGAYYQVGDIVSMVGEDDVTYYAQLRGFLIDQYCEKSACVTWLLPSVDSPPSNYGFDPASYIMGPEEDLPRNLDCMEFIMHAPSDFYCAKTTPYPPVNATAEPGYIWTSLTVVQRRPSSTA